MKTEMKVLCSLTAAALIAGCASGGGSGGGSSGGGGPAIDPALAPLRPGYEPSPCGTLYGYPVPCVPYLPRFPGDPGPVAVPPPLPAFTNWTDLRRDTPTQVTGLATIVFYETRPDGSISSTSDHDQGSEGNFIVQYDAQGKPVHLDLGGGGGPGSRSSSVHGGHVSLAAIGQPWLDLGRNDTLQDSPQTPFTTLTARQIELVANPYLLGWNYQSFGVWNVTDPSWVGFGAATFGAATPASAVPTSGNASFTGKLGGLYVSPAGQGSIATADVRVDANFSARSLSFASSGTTITRDLATSTAASNLNLSGTLTYLPASNAFTGTLTNAGGTMSGSSKGRFYGPTAQELGGVFTLKSPTGVETFAGAYGGKR